MFINLIYIIKQNLIKLELVRRSTLDQFKKIYKELEKQKYDSDFFLSDIEREKRAEKLLSINDPIELDVKNIKKIPTIDQYINLEDVSKKKKKKKKKKINENMKISKFNELFESMNSDDDTFKRSDRSPVNINKNIKNIRNWFPEKNYSTKKEMSIGLVGKYIDLGDIKGYINRIEGKNVIIDSIVEPFGLIDVPLKTVLKKYGKMINKDKNNNVTFNLDLYGPKKQQLVNPPKESKSTLAPKIDGKSKPAKDQKIIDKTYKEYKIKKFSDLSKNLNTTKMKVNKKEVEKILNDLTDSKIKKYDDKLFSKIYKEKAINKLKDLSKKMESLKIELNKTKTFSELIE